jgi:aspartokinase-like uncharacterized kinase
MTTAWHFGVVRGVADLALLHSPVLKIGGSLLLRPDWPTLLQTLVATLDHPLLVVGGGAVVDGLRAIDAANPRPDWLMDDLAIDAMSLTAQIVAHALDLTTTSSPQSERPAVLDVAMWLRETPDPPELPASWDATSDSFAAAVANVTGRGLVLAKSTPPPTGAASLQLLAQSGWIDAWFPNAADDLASIAWAAPAR